MIVEVSPDSPHHKRVEKLGDANSATLGFLPYEAIRQAAAEGRVLASVENDEVKGYTLYGVRVRTGNISLTHLCVDQKQRGQGIARELVEGIAGRNPHRAGIRLSCRKDYEADAMWPKLGFRRLGERRGRSRAGHPLVVWWLPIAAQMLFGEPEQEETRLVVAIDTNILLDIREERNHQASLALTADWVAEAAELVVTSQSLSELSKPRSSEEFESKLSEFRELESSEAAWRTELQPLQDDPTIARVGEKDLRVVAQAAAGGAAYLITRDEHLLRQSERVEQMTSLKLVGPDDFLLRLHWLGGYHGHQTRKIAASGISVLPASQIPSNTELSYYCHQHISERSTDLRERLGVAVARQSGHIVKMISDSGKPLALGSVYRDGARAIITALRCTAEARSVMVLRQMVHHLRSIIALDGSATIVVEDLTSPLVDQALYYEGFRRNGPTWSADLQTGIFRPNDSLPDELAKTGWNGLNAYLIRDYERSAWPAKIFSGNILSYMIPIKPEYARDILSYSEPQERLFELNRKAAVSRTNVYYRSPRFFFETPARVIWWISGGGSLGGVRAISWLDEVETGPPHRLYRKYRDHGVLDKQQVIDIAKLSPKDGPKATAMLFSQTEIFPEPVPIARSRELCHDMNQPGYFRTTQKIDEDTVYKFYTEGMKIDED